MFYLSTNDKGGKKVLFSSLSDLASSATPGDRGWGQVTPFSPTHQLNIYLYKSCVSVWPLAPRFATLNTRSRLFFFDWTENHCSFHWGHWICWSVRLVTPKIFSLFFLTDTNIKTDRQFDDQTIRLFLSLSAICCHFWSAEGRQNLWISMNDNTHRHTPNNTQDTGGTTHKTRGLRYLHRFAFNLQ